MFADNVIPFGNEPDSAPLPLPERIPWHHQKSGDPDPPWHYWALSIGDEKITFALMCGNDKSVVALAIQKIGNDLRSKARQTSIRDRAKKMRDAVAERVEFAADLQRELKIEVRLEQMEL